MSKREELQSANEKFKNALETQVEDIKHNLDQAGKTALIVGGGLVAAYLLSTAFTGSDKKKKVKGEKPNKQETEKSKRTHFKDNLLSTTLKEQAIIFLLGLATERLSAFLKDSDKDEK